MKNVMLENEAEHLRQTARQLGDLLYEKCIAYGGAHNRQVDIWAAVLKQYEDEVDGRAVYVIPDALLFHIPRLTRVFDRIMRIVAHPEGDHLGETPWRDMAGDCLAGIVMPKAVVAPAPAGPCPEPGCERPGGHDGTHALLDAAGKLRWSEPGRGDAFRTEPADLSTWMSSPNEVESDTDGVTPESCGEWFPCSIGDRRCAKPKGHDGRHRCEGGFTDERSQEYLDSLKAVATA